MAITTIEKVMRLPIVFDWVEYKGETVFAGVNIERSEKAGRPMVDIFHCATMALNNSVIKTVQWNKKNFKRSHLTATWEENPSFCMAEYQALERQLESEIAVISNEKE